MNFEALVAAEASGYAAPNEIAVLEADPADWASTLRRLLIETDEALKSAANITGDERLQVLNDLTDERAHLAEALHRVTGEDVDRRQTGGGEEDLTEAAPAGLHACWTGGRVVVWGIGPDGQPAAAEALDHLVREEGAGSIGWERQGPVTLPDGGKAAAQWAPIGQTLGWLVGVGAGQLAPRAGLSLRWLGQIAVWATELVAQGRMIPTLRRSTPNNGQTGAGSGQATVRYRVRWTPALVDPDRVAGLAAWMPGAVSALDPASAPEAVCRSILGAAVDAICRAGAARLVAPATVPIARSRSEVAEAVLAGLDGAAFPAATRPAAELTEELKRWAAAVAGDGPAGLSVRLSPPEADGGWLLSVEVHDDRGAPILVEHALSAATGARAHQIEEQLRRLERLVAPLRRPSGHRGQVVLSSDEAWDLMADTGGVLVAAGFEVRIPDISRLRPAPRLRMVADPPAGPSRVGAQQLAQVRWSVLFGDAELDAATIARLTSEARPLVRVKGRWMALDRADLVAAAAALADRAGITELSGAAIVRHAVGLEGSTLGGPVTVDGNGWAVDLVRGATTNPPQPLDAPEGFVGELRRYQAEASGWLAFLDRAGLGGCLAMDMGLGKTPTVLAHLLANRGEGPVLVIAPPAVLGNWAYEASRFTPDLTVHMHHGSDRAELSELAEMATNTDIILTTYATALRDVARLSNVHWQRVIIDEAQAIKNSASETAQALRQIPARSRLALTGTPVENGLGDLWSILDFTNPGLVGPRPAFVEQLSKVDGGTRGAGEAALRALNGLLVFRRTKSEPLIAAELPDKIDQLDHCGMTGEQIGLYQAVLDRLLAGGLDEDRGARKGQVLAAITALKQICNHPAAYVDEVAAPLEGRSGKLTRLEEIVDAVFAAGERVLIFTHFARWGERLAEHLSQRTGVPIACYHGGLARGARDRLVEEFQKGTGAGALVLSLKAGGSGLNLTAASHVVLYDRWWNPAVEDQARDRAWRIGQTNTVVSHRLVCPGTVDERVEEVVAGKRRIADLVLPSGSSLGDIGPDELRQALGLRPDTLIQEEAEDAEGREESAA
jgi:superfamily II DNA or RNA helicase